MQRRGRAGGHRPTSRRPGCPGQTSNEQYQRTVLIAGQALRMRPLVALLLLVCFRRRLLLLLPVQMHLGSPRMLLRLLLLSQRLLLP